MGILQSLLGVGAAPQQQAGRNYFPKTLHIGNWWQTTLESASGKIAVKTGGYVRVGQYTVPAQQMIHFGYGRGDLPYNQGYLYMKFFDDTAVTPVAIPGVVRLRQCNANESVSLLVAEYRTEQLSGSASDRNSMMAFPEQVAFPFVGEDSKLLIEFLADGTVVNLTKANCIWNTPVTIGQ